MSTNPDWLHYFVVLAETGNFNVAAERLNITSQALSKAIAGLEARYKVTLVARSPRMRGLTPAGEALLLDARLLLAGMENMDRRMADWRDGTPGGPVTLGCVGFWHNYLLPPLLADLLARHPRIRPRIHDMLPGDVERWVVAGEMDIGMLIAPPTHPHLDWAVVAETPVIIVGAPGPVRPWQALGFIVPRFFRSAGATHPATTAAESIQSLDGWPEGPHPRRIVVEVEMLETALQLCEAGVGAAFLPELAVRSRLVAGTLAIAAEPPVTLIERLYVVWRRGVRPTPATRELLSALIPSQPI